MNELFADCLSSMAVCIIPSASIASDADLYDAGLTPFAAIRVMLALEEAVRHGISGQAAAPAELRLDRGNRRLRLKRSSRLCASSDSRAA